MIEIEETVMIQIEGGGTEMKDVHDTVVTGQTAEAEERDIRPEDMNVLLGDLAIHQNRTQIGPMYPQRGRMVRRRRKEKYHLETALNHRQ